MNQLEKFQEIIATYVKYGWRLRRALISPQTGANTGAGPEIQTLFEGAEIRESIVDALWFARPSHDGREAWELRLVGETPYALFETFEADEAEEDREDVRLEMEARLRDYTQGREK